MKTKCAGGGTLKMAENRLISFIYAPKRDFELDGTFELERTELISISWLQSAA